MISNKNNHSEINDILDSTIEGILIVKEGFILNVNKAFLDIMGYDEKNEVIGNLASGCLLPFNEKKYIEFNRNSYQEISLVSKEAKIIPAIIQIKDITYENEEVKMVSILDITDFKNNENILIRQSRMAAMGEILSMISHQWRQPLNAIASTIATIKLKIMKKSSLDSIDDKIEKINQYLQVMSTTIDDFRDFYKEKHKREFTDLNLLVNQGIKLFENSLRDKNIQLTINHKKLDKIFINKNQILQVVINILSNAIDAINHNNIENGEIEISFVKSDHFQTILIKDNAGGINPSIKDKIFEPYFTTKDNYNGTGFGLYMCKVILEHNNYGKIEVDNITDGSCFKIILKV